MSPLIESIKLQDGKFYNLFYHEQRMMRSLRALSGIAQPVQLERMLYENPFPEKGLYKCRIVYDEHSRETTFSPYKPGTINRVKVVEDNDISYEYKFLDRGALNRLFEKREDCDDVLIIRKGWVTDCSFSNIVFRKGREWFTPASPLLQGTMRENLIKKNKIQIREIQKKDIGSFETFKIINAMLEFDNPEIEVSDLVF